MSKKVFVSGHFNVLHPGHLRLLKFAKECGDYLIVGVESDKKAGNLAHVPEEMRLEVITANNWVDEAFILHDTVESTIRKLKPDIIVKGKEWENRINEEENELSKYGGKLIFGSGETVFSSLDLINKDFLLQNINLSISPKDFMSRHNLTKLKIKEIVAKFESISTCVIGDLIIDEYITCEPLGLSQEEPAIVVTPLDSRYFIGGAGIVACHSNGLKSKSFFLSVCGQDSKSKFAKSILSKNNVQSFLYPDENRPTTLKQRFRSGGKSLLRVNHLHQDYISTKIQNKIISKFKELVKNIDLVVFSDFNYGCLPNRLIDSISEIAKENNVLVAADSQTSSQFGDIAKFKNIDLICPTEREARISTKNFKDGLVILLDKLRDMSNPKNIILKLGEEGILVQSEEQINQDWIVDKIAALNHNAKDIAGAGDSLLISSALSLTVGSNIWEASLIGSLSAAIQVGRVGNEPLRIDEIYQMINNI